jgi:GNAT superfamily N-acetyltransferase
MNDDCADLSLRDGARIRIRPIGPADRDKLAEGFERLSLESRHQRFMSAKTELTEEDLRHLTELDGVMQFALGAAVLDTDGNEGEGIGVARFFRAVDDPEVAELGITVVDHWQGRGVGRLLLERLVRAAAARGVRRTRAHLMAENRQVLQLIKPYLQGASIDHDGPLVTIEMRVPRRPVPDASAFWTVMFRLLEAVAKGAIVVPIFFGLTAVDRLTGRNPPAAGDTED